MAPIPNESGILCHDSGAAAEGKTPYRRGRRIGRNEVSMARILIAFGTTEGHTRKIAERVQEWLSEYGIEADLFDTASPPGPIDWGAYQGAILAGSLHQAKHQPSLEKFVIDSKSHLSAFPTLFLSSSMSAVGKDDVHQRDAWKCIDQFYDQTGFTPTLASPVAGALPYTKYNWLEKVLMRAIVSREGGDTDTSRDYEYTDWPELRKLVMGFAKAWLMPRETVS